MNLAVYTFFLSLLLSAALLPFLVRIAPFLGLVDQPNSRKVHDKDIPRIGGVAIVMGMLIPLVLWLPMRADLQSFLFAIALLSIVMILDDRVDLDFRLKLIVQIIASAIVTLHGEVLITHIPYLSEDLPHWLAVPLTILVLVGITNAVNLSDGLDGLVGGTTVLSAGCLGLLAYNANDNMVVMLSLSIAGSTIGFLRFNTHPARVFMGDTGSQCLGFSIGVISILLTQSTNSQISPFTPLLILGLPVLDTFWVIVRRIREKRSPFSADRNHIHHQLLDLGLTLFETIVLIYSVQLFLILAAYYLAYSSDSLIIIVYGLFCGITTSSLILAEHKKFRFHTASKSRIGYLAGPVEYINANRFTLNAPFQFLSIAVPGLLIFGSLFGEKVEYNLSVMSLVLAMILTVALIYKGSWKYNIIRFVTYTTAACVIYIVEASTGIIDLCESCIYIFFGIMAFFVILWMRYSGSDFKFNSLDFLFVVIITLAPSIPGFEQSSIGIMLIGMMIIFYACEIVISKSKNLVSGLHLSVLASLIIISFKGLML